MPKPELSPIDKIRLLNERFSLIIEEITYNGKRVPKAKWSDAIKWMNDQCKTDGART